MHLDGRILARGTELQTDLCIIGTGAAGITLALELAGAPFSIIMLESGGFDPEADTQALAKGEIVGLPTFPLDVSRLRQFGGTTGHWGGFCRAFDPIDFEAREWVPHSGWPITLADVQPYYDRAQELCQVGPPDYDPGQWDLKQTPPLPLASGNVRTRLVQFSPPTRFGVRYREAVLKAPNISVYLHSNVVRIVPSANGKEVKRLDVATLTGNEFNVLARVIVLATGGLENPRLLLASNQVMPKGVGNDNDLVGRFFGDHINLDTAGIMALSDKFSFELYQREQRMKPPRSPLRAGGRMAPVMGLLDLSEQTQRAQKTLNYSAEVRTTYFSAHFLHDERFNEVYRNEGADSRFTQIKEAITTLYENLGDAMATVFHTKEVSHGLYELMSVQEQAPNPLSRVTLSPSKDRLGVPMIRLDWRLSDLDRHTVKVATRLIAQSMGAAGIGRLRVTMNLDAQEWPRYMESSWHPCGTTRMHADPRQGVVDANCRVHGIANLYVAGSSVFTTISSSNPTITIVALSLRLARHLRQALA
jgi:choline dehydrogenase-like flavoprotein